MIENMVIPVFSGFVVAMLVTALVNREARRRTLLDVPNERSSHTTPTPRLGGIGIVAGATVSIALAASWTDVSFAIFAIAIGVAVVGLVDDVRGISVGGKYGAQLIAALAAGWVITPTFVLPLPGNERLVISGAMAVLLAAFWLTAFMNACNFIDGIDGILGSIALATALIALLFVSGSGQIMLASCAGGVLGFLVWNWPPARIFMGDVGSQFLGFAVGSALLLWPTGRVETVSVVLVAAPVLMDTGYTLVRRAVARRNIFAAHREHLYQRLRDQGIGAAAIDLSYAAATMASGIAGLMWIWEPSLRPLAIGVVTLIGVVYGIAVSRLSNAA